MIDTDGEKRLWQHVFFQLLFDIKVAFDRDMPEQKDMLNSIRGDIESRWFGQICGFLDMCPIRARRKILRAINKKESIIVRDKRGDILKKYSVIV